MSLFIRPLNSKQVDKDKDRVKTLLSRVMNKIECGLSMDDVLAAISVGDMQLWCVDDFKAIAVTEVQSYSLYSTLTIVFLAGDGMDDWLDPLINLLSEFGRTYNCKYIEFYGRPGWEKAAPKVGFEKKYTVMARRL